MIIGKDRVVSVSYDLRVDSPDGKLVESVSQDAPLTFIYGMGKLLPKFEDHLKGLGIGDEFDFSLPSSEAYGEFNNEAVVQVPMNIFEVNGQPDDSLLQIGNAIPMMDRSGNRLTGTVLEVNGETVKMDFNHPLAGNNLHFKGQVTEVREASEEELASGLDHACGCGSGCGCETSEDGHKHGGCGCETSEAGHSHGGGCGDGCC
jgi:FKBP-type peptidyl-prolyl cis-trans isomerase SlyD